MSRFAIALVVCAVLPALPATAFATTVVVPDDFPTIQAAIDAEPDTIEVRAGLYDERLIVHRSFGATPMVLRARRGTYGTADPYVHLPRIRSAYFQDGNAGFEVPMRVEGFWFLGDVATRESGADFAIAFASCRFDSGMVSQATFVSHLRFQGCTFFGDLKIATNSYEIVGNVFVRSGIEAHYLGYAKVIGNTVLGPTPIGMHLFDNDSYLYIEDNLVDGAVIGYQLIGANPRLLRNVARACTAQGFLVEGSFNAIAFFTDNRAMGCGGNGFEVRGAGGHFTGNVAGRCGGAGFAMVPGAFPPRERIARGNTSYLNGGAGFLFEEALQAEVDHNISYQNQGPGLQLVGGGTSGGCNDWFANAAGAVVGGTPDATDLSVDPLFCNIAADSVTLRLGSPLLDAAGCGLIGADSLGCGDGTTETLEPGGPGNPAAPLRTLALTAAPNPARRGTHVTFTLPEAASVRVDVVDVQGRVVDTLAKGLREAGTHEVEWSGARPGTYFVRLDVGGRRLSEKLITIR